MGIFIKILRNEWFFISYLLNMYRLENHGNPKKELYGGEIIW